MITTMRSNSTKASKPPPPVPPRPSKNVVAEALAKSRGKGHACVPPVVKSQSYSAINKYSNVVPKIERGVSVEEPPKPATRTLIYQSANIKQLEPQRYSSIEEIRVNLNRKESVRRMGDEDVGQRVMRTSSFKTRPEVILMPPPSVPPTPAPKQLDDRDSSLESLGESEPISRSNSFKTDANNSSDSVISEDERDWNQLDETSDRNHVNTLIDEMFASVLDQPEKVEPVAVIDDANDNNREARAAPNLKLPYDRVTIHTTSKVAAADADGDLINNKSRDSSRSQTIQTNDSKKTIVLIESDDGSIKPRLARSATQPAMLLGGTPPKAKIDDKLNHELLISELSNMKRERQISSKISKRQRRPSENSLSSPTSESRIQHSDWVEVANGEEIRLSSCQITIEDDDDNHHAKHANLISRLEMANLHGLPPLPKSLSGFNIEGGPQTPSSGRTTSSRTSKHSSTSAPNGELGSLKKTSNLDAKLALLRREMYSLRQLDLSLLSQLWSLNESIQDFRHILQEQEERNVLSPPSPSPTTSSGEDVDGDEFFQPSPMRFRLAPPPPPPHRRTSNSSSGTGSSV